MPSDQGILEGAMAKPRGDKTDTVREIGELFQIGPHQVGSQFAAGDQQVGCPPLGRQAYADSDALWFAGKYGDSIAGIDLRFIQSSALHYCHCLECWH